MDKQNMIPSQLISHILKKHVPENFSIGLKFKEHYKEAIILFIHYLVTYAEEIAKEKGDHHINEKHIKEALQEIDQEDLLFKILEEEENFISSSKKKTPKTIQLIFALQQWKLNHMQEQFPLKSDWPTKERKLDSSAILFILLEIL